jgi:hypothetical protein
MASSTCAVLGSGGTAAFIPRLVSAAACAAAVLATAGLACRQSSMQRRRGRSSTGATRPCRAGSVMAQASATASRWCATRATAPHAITTPARRLDCARCHESGRAGAGPDVRVSLALSVWDASSAAGPALRASRTHTAIGVGSATAPRSRPRARACNACHESHHRPTRSARPATGRPIRAVRTRPRPTSPAQAPAATRSTATCTHT